MPRSQRILTLKLPDEFLALCQEDNVAPELVLRGFISDVCGIGSATSRARITTATL